MRRHSACICSTAHLPYAEREGLERLIRCAPLRDGRHLVAHPALLVEPRISGFAVHLGLFDDHPGRPDDVSQEMWALMLHARRQGATWLTLDRHEPPSQLFPTFEGEGEEQGEGSEADVMPRAGRPHTPVAKLCADCGGDRVMRDAWAVWDERTQQWVLGAVFDDAFCETCEADAMLVSQPLCQPENAA